MPKRYRLIPVAIEALQVTPESVPRAIIWCGGREVTEIDALDSTKRFAAINVPTMTGVARASEGDYIIKDSASGLFSVMTKAEFESKYEII